MSRRDFFSRCLKAGIGFSILPSALTYARAWKPDMSGVLWTPIRSLFDEQDAASKFRALSVALIVQRNLEFLRNNISNLRDVDDGIGEDGKRWSEPYRFTQGVVTRYKPPHL